VAIHPELKSLIRESLREYLHVAEYCVQFEKDVDWPQDQIGGCLGYPAAVMLFSIVDTIGSFHRGSDLSVLIEGKTRDIRKDGFQHFFVLNSEYYGQALDEAALKRLYDNFRSLLVHNAALAPLNCLIKDPANAEAFPQLTGSRMVNVQAFLQISRVAVQKFLARLDQIVPGSQQAANISLKR
jgi:hypothetical protein